MIAKEFILPLIIILCSTVRSVSVFNILRPIVIIVQAEYRTWYDVNIFLILAVLFVLTLYKTSSTSDVHHYVFGVSGTGNAHTFFGQRRSPLFH